MAVANVWTVFGPQDNPVVLKEQQRSVMNTFLAGQRGLLVAHSVGTGKTLTAIATAVNCMRHEVETGVEQVKIVCPKALEKQWNSQIVRFLQGRHPEQIPDIEVLTQEGLSKQMIKHKVVNLEGGLFSWFQKKPVENPAEDYYEHTQVEGDIVPQEEALDPQEELAIAKFMQSAGLGGLAGGAEASADKTMIIYDEAHRLTGLTQDQAFAMLLAQRVNRIMCLTATPIVNIPSDASIQFSLFENMFPLANAIEEGGAFKNSPGWLPLDERTFRRVQLDDDVVDGRIVQIVNESTKNHQMAKVAKWISYQMPQDPGTEFPTRINVSLDETRVDMTPIQHQVQMQVEKIAQQAEGTAVTDGGQRIVSNAFLNKTRQYCNTVHKVPEKFSYDIKKAVRDALEKDPDSVEPKQARIRDTIQEEIRKRQAGLPSQLPVIVYSEFLENGIERVKQLIATKLTTSQGGAPAIQSVEQAKNRLITISGQTTPNEKAMEATLAKIKVPTNQDVLFISSAGSQGIDTRGVRQMHVVEPPWNQANLDQIIGRAIRHKSHSDLPEDERNVRIFMWTSTKTPAQIAAEKAAERQLIDDTADQRISKIIARKLQANRQFLEIFRCNSINVMPYLTAEDLPNSIRRSAESIEIFFLMGQQLNGIRTRHDGTQSHTTIQDINLLDEQGFTSFKKPGFTDVQQTYGEAWTATQSNEIRELAKLFKKRHWPNVVGQEGPEDTVEPIQAVVLLPDVPAEVPGAAVPAVPEPAVAEPVPEPLPEDIVNLISEQIQDEEFIADSQMEEEDIELVDEDGAVIVLEGSDEEFEDSVADEDIEVLNNSMFRSSSESEGSESEGSESNGSETEIEDSESEEEGLPKRRRVGETED